MSDTQKKKIIDYLTAHDGITTMDAFVRLGITKLTTRISELRRDGYDITSETVLIHDDKGKVTTRFNRYKLNR